MKRIFASMTKRRFAWTLALLGAITAYAAPPVRAQYEGLDGESRKCLECHEGYYHEGPPPGVSHGDGAEHAIAVDYAQLSSTNPSLEDPSALDPALRLFDGMIGCATCHVPYNEYDHLMLSKKRAEEPDIPDPMLVMDNTGSALCTGCHLK